MLTLALSATLVLDLVPREVGVVLDEFGLYSRVSDLRFKPAFEATRRDSTRLAVGTGGVPCWEAGYQVILTKGIVMGFARGRTGDQLGLSRADYESRVCKWWSKRNLASSQASTASRAGE